GNRAAASEERHIIMHGVAAKCAAPNCYRAGVGNGTAAECGRIVGEGAIGHSHHTINPVNSFIEKCTTVAGTVLTAAGMVVTKCATCRRHIAALIVDATTAGSDRTTALVRAIVRKGAKIG